MRKRITFGNKRVAYALLVPQFTIIFVFFYWPAAQSVYQAFTLSDPWGQSVKFVWFDNIVQLFGSPEYYDSIFVTFVFSICTSAIAMSLGLLFAVYADRVIRGLTAYRSLLIWPYAVAPVIAGALWLFLFHPAYGAVAFALERGLGLKWDPLLNSVHGMTLVVVATAWKQISYNFVFFMAGLQAIPRSLVEAAAIDGAGPFKRFLTIVLPLLSPITFFLLVMNIVFVFFDTFGIIEGITEGGPGDATNILVYKIYTDGFLGLDLGSSAAQSVVLMLMVVALTVVQFRYIERKVHYAG